MTREEKREALRGKIDAARARFGDRSPEDIVAEAASTAIEYAKQNPLVVLGGAVMLGLTLGRLSRKGRKAVTISSVLGRIATDAAIGFAFAMYEKASQRTEVHDAKTQDLIEETRPAAKASN